MGSRIDPRHRQCRTVRTYPPPRLSPFILLILSYRLVMSPLALDLQRKFDLHHTDPNRQSQKGEFHDYADQDLRHYGICRRAIPRIRPCLGGTVGGAGAAGTSAIGCVDRHVHVLGNVGRLARNKRL